MISKPQIKLLQSLQQKKNREELHLFVAEGKKIVDELMSSAIETVHIYTSATYSGNKPYTLISEVEMKKISSLAAPQNILALCKIPVENSVTPDLTKEFVLVLDTIRDPGNMGTIIRIADWFGVKFVYCTGECVDAYNPKVVQASMGSIARINPDYKNLDKVMKECSDKQIPVYGASLTGKNILTKPLTANGILIIGNESTGISAELGKYVSQPVKIPSCHAGTKNKGAESLNAAVATAILCAEFKRKELMGRDG